MLATTFEVAHDEPSRAEADPHAALREVGVHQPLLPSLNLVDDEPADVGIEMIPHVAVQLEEIGKDCFKG